MISCDGISLRQELKREARTIERQSLLKKLWKLQRQRDYARAKATFREAGAEEAADRMSEEGCREQSGYPRLLAVKLSVPSIRSARGMQRAF